MTDLTCTPPPLETSQIEFNTGEKWIFRISEKGIVFNHEEWPDATPSDFAQAFCAVLEKQYKVLFVRPITT